MSIQAADLIRRYPIRQIVLSEEEIRNRVQTLAREISQDYRGGDLLLVGILKGAQIFATDLLRHLSIPAQLEFVSISRYRRSPEVKEVQITQDLQSEVALKDVLIVEDIVDTGLTLNFLVKLFAARKPASVRICSLLDRPALRLAEIPLSYVGFDVSEDFLVGYGLDYQERFRNLPFIATLDFDDSAVYPVPN